MGGTARHLQPAARSLAIAATVFLAVLLVLGGLLGEPWVASGAAPAAPSWLPLPTTGSTSNRPLPAPPTAPLAYSPEGVFSTTDIWDGSVHAGFYAAPNGVEPGQVLYDPYVDQIIVYDQATASVSFVDPSSGRVVGGLTTGLPGHWANTEMAENASGAGLFILDTADQSVLVVNVSSETIQARIPIGVTPETFAFDSRNGDLYLTQLGNASILRVDVRNGTLAGSFSSGLPTSFVSMGIAYDPVADRLVVANGGGANVSVLYPSNGTVAARASTGSEPWSIAVDSARRQVWIANYLSSNVTVLNASSFQVLGSAKVEPYPTALAFANGTVLVPNLGWNNITVVNETSRTMRGGVASGSSPWSVAWDPVNQHAYVCNRDNDNLSVILSPARLTEGRSIAIGASPGTPAYDPVDQLFLVPEIDSLNLTLFNASNGAYEGEVPTSLLSRAVTYDSVDRRAFVSEFTSSYGVDGVVQVVNVTSRTVIANVTAGLLPGLVVFDPSTDQAFVANQQGTNVTAINGSTLATRSIPLPSTSLGGPNYPFGLAVDPVHHRLYVSKLTTETGLVVVNTSSDTVVGSISTQDNVGRLAIDPASSTLYVVEVADDFMAVINATSGGTTTNISLSAGPGSVLFDPANQEVYVGTSGGPGNVTAFSDYWFTPVASFPVGAEPYDLALDTSDGHLGVTANHQGTLVITGRLPVYPVRFEASGLPAGTTWGVNLSVGPVSTNSTDLNLSLVNGTYSFEVVSPSSYFATPANGTFEVAGSTDTVVVAFSLRTYEWTFTETGLPQGSFWTVILTGPDSSFRNTSPGSSLSFDIANGSYGVKVYSSDARWTPTIPSTTLQVQGRGGVVPEVFGLVSFAVEIFETGLPNGTSWTITARGSLGNWTGTSTGPSVQLALPNGSYGYRAYATSGGWVAQPGAAPISVDGQNTSVVVAFTPFVFNVTFEALGLPSRVAWSLNLSNGDSTTQLPGTQEALSLANGSYTYRITTSDDRWAPNASARTFTVQGSALTVGIRFHPELFTAEFVETGLPSGSAWVVLLNGTPARATSPSIDCSGLFNGSYPYTVEPVSGFGSNVTQGRVTVSGSVVLVDVGFSPATSGTPGGVLSSFPPDLWAAVVVLVAVVIGVTLLVRRARQRTAR